VVVSAGTFAATPRSVASDVRVFRVRRDRAVGVRAPCAGPPVRSDPIAIVVQPFALPERTSLSR